MAGGKGIAAESKPQFPVHVQNQLHDGAEGHVPPVCCVKAALPFSVFGAGDRQQKLPVCQLMFHYTSRKSLKSRINLAKRRADSVSSGTGESESRSRAVSRQTGCRPSSRERSKTVCARSPANRLRLPKSRPGCPFCSVGRAAGFRTRMSFSMAALPQLIRRSRSAASRASALRLTPSFCRM